MFFMRFVALSLLMTVAQCALLETESGDIKSILEDILKRLDDKETRLSQLEAIVRAQETIMREQQGQITTLEEEVAVQKQQILNLQPNTEVKPETEFGTTDSETSENSTINGICTMTLFHSFINCHFIFIRSDFNIVHMFSYA